MKSRQFGAFCGLLKHLNRAYSGQLAVLFKACVAALVATALVASGQDRQGPNDFLTTETFTVNEGNIYFGFVDRGDGTLQGTRAMPYRLRNPIQAGDELQFAGHVVMRDARGIERVYYRMFHQPAGTEGFTNITRDLDLNPAHDQGQRRNLARPEVFISADDLIDHIGSEVEGCDILPNEAAGLGTLRPLMRTNVLQDLANIETLRDQDPSEWNIEIPALNNVSNVGDFNPDCLNFVEGEGSLGPWGQFIVSEMIGTNRGQTYHVDVDPREWFEVPAGYFGDACPNYNSLSTDRKLAVWVSAIAGLAMKESSCNEDAGAQGTNSWAEGLLQGPSNWGPSGSEIGRGKRNEGCNARESNLRNYEDALSCGLQILGDTLCGAYSINGAITCRPDRRQQRFFNGGGYFEPLRSSQALIREQVSRVRGCR
ncbi:MAG: hypothetical protein HRT45_02550 [Bdellovibrionales bacterium]|nr:hypothetical protein [Bdellovibrionales bacterium]